jgi:hypothetical protein
MVAYATGLVCEQRPDLADGVRAAVQSAVLGDTLFRITDLILACSARGDTQGAIVCDRLHRIIHHPDQAPTTLPLLAEALRDSFEWFARSPTHEDLDLRGMYAHFGFDPCWEHAKTPNDLRGLRRLIVLHAHTVSLGADLCASWAKAHLDHLDALEPAQDRAATQDEIPF